MYGADVFVLVNNAGQWTLQDRFASGFFMPNLDGAHVSNLGCRVRSRTLF